ncbi:MAG: thiamine phosphate synthase [Magnetococcales bacterium]|nr:thiamine phosphate synthase [Magnetococcales bacterium]MBF0321403.1 thiamine phosphate synthase [Magnetococcales bacterium]
MTLHPSQGGLYPILDFAWLARHAPSWLQGDGPERLARKLGASSISLVQLRCKGSGLEQYHFMTRWVSALRSAAPTTAIIINDRVDLALALEADGVHVGQDDLPVAVCRRLLGRERIIGLSTHTLDEVAAAQQSGADYIGFGPIFATHTKADALTARGIAALATACRHTALPLVAIGGIDLKGLQEVAQTGAWGAALISGWFKPDGRDALTEAVAAWTMTPS